MDAYVDFIRAVIEERSEIRKYMRDQYWDLIKSKTIFDQPERWRLELEKAMEIMIANRMNSNEPLEKDSEVVKLFEKFLFSVRMHFTVVVREYHKSSRACIAWEIHELLMAEDDYNIGYIVGRYSRGNTIS